MHDVMDCSAKCTKGIAKGNMVMDGMGYMKVDCTRRFAIWNADANDEMDVRACTRGNACCTCIRQRGTRREG